MVCRARAGCPWLRARHLPVTPPLRSGNSVTEAPRSGYEIVTSATYRTFSWPVDGVT